MRIRIEAKPGELTEKSTRFVETLSFRLQAEAPDLADALYKALPKKEHTLKYPAMREMAAIAQDEYTRLMGLMTREIEAVLSDRGHSTSLDFAVKSLDADLGEEEVWLDSLLASDFLEKGAGHKYLRRWNNSSPPPKYAYAYDLTHDNTTAAYKVGDKVRVEHKGKMGHFEVLGESKAPNGERMLTVRHDETGHELQVSEGFLHQAFARTHYQQFNEIARQAMDARYQGLEKKQLDKILARDDKIRRIYDPHKLMPGHVQWGVLQEVVGHAVTELRELISAVKSPDYDWKRDRDILHNRFKSAKEWFDALGNVINEETRQATHEEDHPGKLTAEKAREELEKARAIMSDLYDGWYMIHREEKPNALQQWYTKIVQVDAPETKKRLAAHANKKIAEMQDWLSLALVDYRATQMANAEHELEIIDAPIEQTRAGDVKVVVHRSASLDEKIRPVSDSLAQIRRELDAVNKAGFSGAVKDLTIHLRGRKIKFNPLSKYGAAGQYHVVSVKGEGQEKSGEIMLHTAAFSNCRGPVTTGVLAHEVGHRFYYRNLPAHAREIWVTEIANRSTKLNASEIHALRDAVIDPDADEINVPAMQARLRASGVYGAEQVADNFDSFEFATHTVPRHWVEEFFENMVDHPMVSPFVSFYGGNNASEYFAEVFSKYVTKGPRSLPEWARATFEVVAHAGGGLRKAFEDGEDEDGLEKAGGEGLERPGHKYLKRWRGKGGEWHYEYAEDTPSLAQGEAQQAKPTSQPEVELRSVPKADEGQIVADLSERPPWYLGELLERVKAEQKTTAETKRGTPMHLYQWERMTRQALEVQIVEQYAEPVAADPVPKTASKPQEPQQLGFSFTAQAEHVPEEPTKEPTTETPETPIEATPLHTDTNAEAHDAEPDVDTDATPQETDEPAALPTLEAPAEPSKRGKGSRRKHVEVGEHVYGSRADLAEPRSASDLAALTPIQQKRFCKKSKLLPAWEPEDLLGQGWSPGAILMRSAVERLIAPEPPDSLAARQLYMNGIDFLARSYEHIRTHEDFEAFLTEWHYLVLGFKAVRQNVTEESLFRARDAEMLRRGMPLNITYDEYAALKKEAQDIHNKQYTRRIEILSKVRAELTAEGVTKARIIEKRMMAAVDNDSQLKEWAKRDGAIREIRSEYADAAGDDYGYRGWKIAMPDLMGRDIKIELNQSHGYTVYAGFNATSRQLEQLRENPYALQLSALGERMVKAVATPHGVVTGPKGLQDAYRQARAWQREEVAANEQETQMFALLEGKQRAVGRLKRFRWQRQMTGRVERVGGRDVPMADEKELAKAFRLKNVQFGDWVSDDDAATHLKAAHGALFDLADIVGLPDEAVSLNGRLSISFGGRGTGFLGGSAHYESDGEIINLTKFAGGGCLAHEYGHALDSILAKAANPESTQAELFLSNGSHGQIHPQVRDAMTEVMDLIHWADLETAKKYRRMMVLDRRLAKNEHLTQGERAEWRALSEESNSWKRSSYFERSRQMNTSGWGKKFSSASSKTPYWERPTELFARCFEAWAEDQLTTQDRSNAYLVDGTGVASGQAAAAFFAMAYRDIMKKDPDDPWAGHPYPMDEERDRINDAISRLVSAIKETHALKKALDWLDERDALRKAAGRLSAGDGSELAEMLTCDEALANDVVEVDDDEDDAELEKAEGEERAGHKYVRRWRGPHGEWQYEYAEAKEPGEHGPAPSAPPRASEDPGERWGEEEAKEWLIREGTALAQHQMMDPTTKDNVGLNTFDMHRWPSIVGDVRAMRAMLKKYKRQIGGEDYYRAGCADRVSDYRMSFEIHPKFGSLNMRLSGRLPTDAWQHLYRNILKPQGWFFTDGVFVLKREYFDKIKDQAKFLTTLAEALPADTEFGELPEILSQSPEKAKEEAAKQATGALERAKAMGKTPVDGVFEALRQGKLRDVVAMRWHPEDGSFEFRQSADKTVAEVFKNDSGILKGIVFWDPKGIERGTWERYVFDLEVAKQAIEEIRKRAPHWQIVTEGLEDAERQEQERQTTLQKPLPELVDKLAPGITLYPYQNEGVRFLQKTNGRALIGDEMGLGKTAQCLGYVVAEKKRAIAVVPKMVRRNWIEESHRFFPGSFNSIELDSAALLKIKRQVDKDMPGATEEDKRKMVRTRLGLDTANLASINYESIEKFMPYIDGAGFDTLVVDESHRMKNPKAKVTQAIKRLAKESAHRILLSGTAIKNRRGELFEQVQLVRPGLFGNAQEIQHTTIGGTVKKMREFYLQRSKKQVLKDLPEKNTSILHQEVDEAPDLTTSPAKFISNAKYFAKADALEAGKSEAEAIALGEKAAEDAKVELEEMKEDMDPQEWVDFFTKRSIEEYGKVKFALAQAKAPASVAFAKEIIEGSESNVLIFTESKAAARMMHAELGPELSVIHTGDESFEKREAAKKLFHADKRPEDTTQRVMILTIPSAREGVTLTAADKVIFNDLPWTAADIAQAEARAHRIGQKNAVDIYWTTIAGNSMDQAITDLIRKKYRLHAMVNERRPVTEEEKKWQEAPIKISDIVAQIMGRDPSGTVEPKTEHAENAEGEKVTVTTINPEPAPETVATKEPKVVRRKAVARKPEEAKPEAPKPEAKPEKPARHKYDTSERTYSQTELDEAAKYHRTAGQHIDDFPPALRDRARFLHQEAEGNPIGASWQDVSEGEARKLAKDFGGGAMRAESRYLVTTAGGSLMLHRLPAGWRLQYTTQVAPVEEAMRPPAPEAPKPEAPKLEAPTQPTQKPVTRRAVTRKEAEAKQLELFKALVRSLGAASAVGLLEDARADEFYDWTKPIADADGWAYERVQEALAAYGYGPADYEEGGRLFGMAVNELLDLARKLRSVD